MSKYEEVKSIRDEVWTSAYRYKVYNGIRIVEMKLKQHLPSHMSIAGTTPSYLMTDSLRHVTDAMK